MLGSNHVLKLLIITASCPCFYYIYWQCTRNCDGKMPTVRLFTVKVSVYTNCAFIILIAYISQVILPVEYTQLCTQ